MRTSAPTASALALLLVALPFVPLPSAGAAPSSSPADRPASDPRVDWLAKNAVRLRSIAPADRDFSDLKPLEKILAGKRIVLLGEESHGDGTTFLAKARLIEFLHEEMGFDVLAFESGLYDCRKVDEALRRGEEPPKAARRGLSAIWSRSEQVLPLFDYLGKVAASKQPIAMAGFDNQFTGAASYQDLVKDLSAFLRSRGSKAMDGPEGEAFGGILQKLVEGAFEEGEAGPPPAEAQKGFFDRLEGMRQELAGKPAGGKAPASATASPAASTERDDAAFWRQLLESTATLARMAWDPEASTGEGRNRVRRMRDQQMARNLLWLAEERYPGRKIVVWAATYHAARNLRKIDPGQGNPALLESYRTMETLGDGVSKALGERMYTLAFTAFEGSVLNALQTTEPVPLEAPTSGSLEDLMARAGLENALVDFRNPPKGGDWLRQPLISRPLGYTEMKADWGEIVDGMLFTRKMEPSRRAGR